MRQMLNDADVILLGEVHDDPLAHRAQTLFVRSALADGGGALSLETLDREDAKAVARLNALIERGQATPRRVERILADTTLATWPNWRAFYLPSVLAAARQGRPVVAANAPSEYVTAARVAGYRMLFGLDDAQQRLFDLPADLDAYPAYRERFEATMRGHGGASVDDPARQPSEPTTRPDGREAVSLSQAGPPAPSNSADLDGYYRAQLVWDATMARSIAAARLRHGVPVVHLVGNFHVDFDAALTAMLEERGLKVLTVSFVPAESSRLRPADAGRADVVIYTTPPERFAEMTPAEPTMPTMTPAPATRPATRRVAPPVTRPAVTPARPPSTTRPAASFEVRPATRATGR